MKRKLSAKQLQQPNIATGVQGEQRALIFLQSLNYSILTINFQSQFGEIDIIAYDPTNTEIVFCEVKTRTTSEYGHPSTAVNWKKQQNLRRTAQSYLATHHTQLDFRFDLITISSTTIDHLKNYTL